VSVTILSIFSSQGQRSKAKRQNFQKMRAGYIVITFTYTPS